jgi:hypothetical protein
MPRENSPAPLAGGNRAGGINSVPRSDTAPLRPTQWPGSDLSAMRRQCHAERICHIGLVADLLDQIAPHYGIGADLNQRLARYAGLGLDTLRRLGGDRFPAIPPDRVGGG